MKYNHIISTFKFIAIGYHYACKLSNVVIIAVAN